MGYDIAIIRELLEAAFSEEDLSNFCFDHYKPVYEQFTTGQTKSTRVRLLITYAEKNNLIDDLLDKVKKKNPHKYGEFEPRLKAARQEEKKSGSDFFKSLITEKQETDELPGAH